MFRAYLGIDPQTGKPKRTTRRGFKTKKAASLAAAQLELQASKGDIQKPKEYLFKDVYAEWYDNYIHTVRESTWNRTAGMFDNHILPIFGNKRMLTITTKQVQQAVKTWFEETTANYKRWYNYTVAVFDYALKQGYVTKNPAKAVTLPKKSAFIGDKPANFWSKTQLNQFFSHIDAKNDLNIYIMFRLLAYTGCRRGELLALEWDDVSFKNKTLRINKTLTQGLHGKQIIQAPKTKNSRRTITLDDETIQWLKKWKLQQQQSYLIFGFNTLQPHQLILSNSNNSYHSLNTPAKRLKKIIKAYDLKPITIHGFRHSHISALLSAGVPVTAVQLRVGHASPEVTLSVYSHITQEQSREAAKKLVNYLEN